MGIERGGDEWMQSKLYLDPEELSNGLVIYTHKSDREFVVECTGRYGLACTTELVGYRNVYPTDDYKAGQLWFMETSLVLKLFYTYGESTA